MANMYNINGLSYTCHENPEWFTRAMFGGRLVQGGYIRALMGIKGEELLSMIDLQNKILQADGKDCAWTPNQIIKLSEKKAKVTTYKINLEQCIDELENKRTMYLMSPGATNDSLPTELENATLQLIAIGLSNEIEEMIVGGNSAVDSNQFDGMETVLMKSSEAAKMVGAKLTKDNVLDAIEKVYDEVKEDVLQSEDAGTLYIFGSYGARRILRNALSKKSNQVLAESWTVDDADKKNPRMYYLGVEFVPVKGIGQNTLICIDGTNAFLLTDLMADLDNIEMGAYPKPQDNKVWIKGRLRLGFVIPFEDEAVIWSDKVTAAQKAGVGSDDLSVVPNSIVFVAEGEAKSFSIITKTGVTPEVATTVAGFTIQKGATAASNGMNVTTVTVTTTSNSNGLAPKTGQVTVKLPDSDRGVVVTLNQRNDTVDEITN